MHTTVGHTPPTPPRPHKKKALEVGWRDHVGHPLTVGDRVVKVDRPTGAVLWAHNGTVVGLGRTLVHVQWTREHYDTKKRYHAVRQNTIRKRT